MHSAEQRFFLSNGRQRDLQSGTRKLEKLVQRTRLEGRESATDVDFLDERRAERVRKGIDRRGDGRYGPAKLQRFGQPLGGRDERARLQPTEQPQQVQAGRQRQAHSTGRRASKPASQPTS